MRDLTPTQQTGSIVRRASTSSRNGATAVVPRDALEHPPRSQSTSRMFCIPHCCVSSGLRPFSACQTVPNRAIRLQPQVYELSGKVGKICVACIQTVSGVPVIWCLVSPMTTILAGSAAKGEKEKESTNEHEHLEALRTA